MVLPPRQIERRSALSSEHLPALTKRSNCRADIRKAFDQQSVARCFKEPAVVRGNRRIDQLGPDRSEPLKGAALVRFHEPRVTGHVGGKDGSETAGRGHGRSGPSAVVVVEYTLTLAQLAHHDAGTTNRRLCPSVWSNLQIAPAWRRGASWPQLRMLQPKRNLMDQV